MVVYCLSFVYCLLFVVCLEVDQWDEEDVSQWLEGIGMAEYIPIFIQRNVVGRELLRLRRSDLQVPTHACNMHVACMSDQIGPPCIACM